MIIATNAVSIVCIAIAAVLAIQEKDGWGWFLFVAVLAGQSIKVTEYNKNKKDSTPDNKQGNE